MFLILLKICSKKFLFIPNDNLPIQEISVEEKESYLNSPLKLELDFGVLFYSNLGAINVRASKLAKAKIYGDAILMRT